MSTVSVVEELQDVFGVIHQAVLSRNAAEAAPFVSVYESNLTLQKIADDLQYRCEVLEQTVMDQNTEIEKIKDEAGGKGPNKNEVRQREKIEKLQEQLNEKLRAEVETTEAALKTAKEISSLKDTNTAQDATISSLKEENERAEKTISHLTAELTDAQSVSSLAEKQYMGLKDSIRSLQEENDELKKANAELVDRVVIEKEKMVDQMMKMNEMVEKLQKEVEMLRCLQKQEEKSPGWFKRSVHTDDPKINLKQEETKKSESGRRWGTLGVICPTEPKLVLQAHAQEATAVRYDGTGTDLVATASSDSTVKIWDTGSGQVRATLRGGSGYPMLGVDISGGLAVGCGSDKTCRVWNLRTQRMIHQLAGHSQKITCCRLFQNEKGVITGSADRSLKVWDISRSTYRQTTTMRHSSTSNSLDVSNDAVTVVSGHMDGGLRFWDMRTADRTADISSLHEGGITSVYFSPSNNTHLLTSGRDSTLKLVDMRTCTTLQTFFHGDFRTLVNYASCSLSPDGVYAAAGSGTSGDVFVWRVSDGKLVSRLHGHGAGVCGVAWGGGGTNGQQVASVDRNGVMILWA
uniref:Autophagy-related protein 16 domain-containing protein n=1 Tax=Trieres chinensis TaxID=1514140 RepID=A0A7S2AAH2_TRICV